MKANKKKSAIVEFIPRLSKNKYIEAEEIEGVLVVSKYKYLGLWLNQKLTLDDTNAYIYERNQISSKLGFHR